MGPILKWESEIGIGALGGSLSPGGVEFCVSWDQIMAGEDFEAETVGGDEGELWKWKIRFIPEGSIENP
jgi:hypothetical protein